MDEVSGVGEDLKLILTYSGISISINKCKAKDPEAKGARQERGFIPQKVGKGK